MPNTLKDLWNRLTGNRSADAVEREVEREQMSSTERHTVGESVDDRKADVAAAEHLGGVSPERLLGEDAPPEA